MNVFLNLLANFFTALAERNNTAKPTISKHLEVTLSNRNAQRILFDLGYYKGDIDGIIGAISRKAITNFQKDHRLPISEILDDITKAALITEKAKPIPKPVVGIGMKMSKKGVELLADYEALYLTVYKDAVKKLTIGFGHLLTKKEVKSGVIVLSDGTIYPWKNGLNRDQSIHIFHDEIKDHEDNLNKSLPKPIPQHKYDALMMFSFNCGKGAVYGSNESGMMRLIRAGNLITSFPKYAIKWVNGTIDGQKVKLQGLVNRRLEEIEVWNDASYTRER